MAHEREFFISISRGGVKPLFSYKFYGKGKDEMNTDEWGRET